MARILVVDDEASIREILSRRLTQWGHEVVTANGAESALTKPIGREMLHQALERALARLPA